MPNLMSVWYCMMSGHCRLESFGGGGGVVNGTESHQHDKGDLWTLDKALRGLSLVYKVGTLRKEHFY